MTDEASKFAKLKPIGRKVAGAFDIIDAALTGFSIGLAIVFAVFLRIDVIMNAIITSGLETPYQLTHSVLYSTENHKPIYTYIEKALATGSEMVDGVNVSDYLNDLYLNNVCWKLVRGNGSVVFGNCTGYKKRVVTHFKNGTLEMWYR